jgi:periplasmic protein TonB
MGSAPINPNPANQEPELHLLIDRERFEEPLWKSLPRQLDEFFFPKKLPPLKLESKPEPVKDIWGFYSYWKQGALGAVGYYALLAGVIVLTVVIGRRVVTAAPKQEVKVQVIDPSDLPPLTPSKTEAGGGGGGGDRDVLQASHGKLPKFSMQQITPPAAVIRNLNPKLAVEPTIVIPPTVHLAMANDAPNLGDPMSHAVMPSNGTGSDSGIGSGSGGGVGSGKGPGFGPGEGGGVGGGVFRVGGGVTAPIPIYEPEPEFSEEARKAKYQGVCTLGLIVGVDGRPTNIHVLNALGMGLDEKAIEAVKTWKFEPGKKDGHPVATVIAVEVEFHLY